MTDPGPDPGRYTLRGYAKTQKKRKAQLEAVVQAARALMTFYWQEYQELGPTQEQIASGMGSLVPLADCRQLDALAGNLAKALANLEQKETP